MPVDTVITKSVVWLKAVPPNPQSFKKSVAIELASEIVLAVSFILITWSSSSDAGAEVPLLFESGMDYLFDTIIAPVCSKEKQNELINARNKETALYLKEINSTSKFDENLGKIEFLIENNKSKEEYIDKINKVIKEIENRIK